MRVCWLSEELKNGGAYGNTLRGLQEGLQAEPQAISLLPGERFREEDVPFHSLSHFLLCGAVSGNLRRLLTDFGEISQPDHLQAFFGHCLREKLRQFKEDEFQPFDLVACIKGVNNPVVVILLLTVFDEGIVHEV